MIQVLVLLLREFGFELVSAFDTSGKVITRTAILSISETARSMIRISSLLSELKRPFRYFSQVIRDLDLHAVADILVFLDAAISLEEGLLILLVE